MRQCVVSLAAVLVLSTFALAQGVADQQNDPATDRSFSCGDPSIGNGTLAQSFQPSLSPLVAVELRLRVGDSFPSDGTSTTARILAADGTTLGEGTAGVAGPQDEGTQLLVRFDFDAIDVTTGDTYLVEWDSPSPSILMWMGTSGGTGGTDSYADGFAYSCVGNPWPIANTDFSFVTYAAEEEAAAAGCGSEIEALAAKVRALAGEGVLSRRTARLLEQTLDCAGRALERQHPRLAIAKLLLFKAQVHIGTRLRKIPHSVGSELAADAWDAIACIRASMPERKHHHRSWSHHHSSAKHS